MVTPGQRVELIAMLDRAILVTNFTTVACALENAYLFTSLRPRARTALEHARTRWAAGLGSHVVLILDPRARRKGQQIEILGTVDLAEPEDAVL